MQLPCFDSCKVLVVGDLMLDRYWSGGVSRISPEAPVPIVRVTSIEDRPGGAGNVALNVARLGASPILVGSCGLDANGNLLIDALRSSGVNCRVSQRDDFPTITKLRVLSQHQQLIRLDFEQPNGEIGQHSTEEFQRGLGEADVVILSDYAKGALSNAAHLIKLAKETGVPALVDPKGTDFQRYAGAFLITPNFGEFQAVVGPCKTEAELVSAGLRLIEQLSLEALVVTRGEEGMSLMTKDGCSVHLPAQAREVFDVTGAGDTVIATIATALASGMSLEKSVFLANVAAGIVVGKVGTASVTPVELSDALNTSQALRRGAIGEPELVASLAVARSKGDRIVATNGCFDILHAGHVEYLQQARGLGDRLIVLVNSDQSVKRLKGEDRPLNKLADRMAVLAALQCVDWVIPFDEDTPRDLLCRLLPDVLVKGGDYSDIKQIAGHDCVLANGGEVRTLGFKEGYSTTSLIDAIKGSP